MFIPNSRKTINPLSKRRQIRIRLLRNRREWNLYYLVPQSKAVLVLWTEPQLGGHPLRPKRLQAYKRHLAFILYDYYTFKPYHRDTRLHSVEWNVSLYKILGKRTVRDRYEVTLWRFPG